MQWQKLPIVSTGAGAVADQRTDAFQGILAGIYFEIGDLASGAVDVVVSDDETGAPILTITNASASGWYAPKIPAYDTAGAPALHASGGTGLQSGLPVAGELKVVVTGAGNTHAGSISFFVA